MINLGKTIPRRAVLRGLGASIALPLLDSMVPAFASEPPETIDRLSIFFSPNGMNMARWTPAGGTGGCAGSTSGGLKIVRFLVLGKQASVHIHKLIHPQAVRRIKLDGKWVIKFNPNIPIYSCVSISPFQKYGVDWNKDGLLMSKRN